MDIKPYKILLELEPFVFLFSSVFQRGLKFNGKGLKPSHFSESQSQNKFKAGLKVN